MELNIHRGHKPVEVSISSLARTRFLPELRRPDREQLNEPNAVLLVPQKRSIPMKHVTSSSAFPCLVMTRKDVHRCMSWIAGERTLSRRDLYTSSMERFALWFRFDVEQNIYFAVRIIPHSTSSPPPSQPRSNMSSTTDQPCSDRPFATAFADKATAFNGEILKLPRDKRTNKVDRKKLPLGEYRSFI